MTIRIIRTATLGLPVGTIRTFTASVEAALVADKEAVYDASPAATSGIATVTADAAGNLYANGQPFQAPVSGAVKISQLVPRWVNAADLGVDGPMTSVSMPVPAAYQAMYGSYNREFAYGTPIYFSSGWNGYKYWMAAAPYPASSGGAFATISIGTPGVVTSFRPPPPGTAVSFSTTGALPTGLFPGVTYYVSVTGYAEGSCQLSATPGGTSIATSGTQSGTHTLHYVGGQASISIGSPAVIGCAQAVPPGTPIIFGTTGALPTGLVAGQVYFVSATGWTAQAFSVSLSPGGPLVNTSGTQSGSQTWNIYAPKFENPYVLVSNDGMTWSEPPGIGANPIADVLTASNAVGTDVGSYYADPYIVAAPDQSKLYICWHWFSRQGAIKATILISESSDGRSWSAPVAISNSASTGFQPNSVSLLPFGPGGGAGWTMVAIDTGAAGQPYIYTQTANATPYSGWAAPGAVYNGEWSQCAANHPLSRKWWHQHTIAIEGGGLLSVASDNNSAGGTAWSLVSWDYGATWAVRQLSAYDPSTAGGVWYRPSICAINDSGSQSLQFYCSTIGWPRAPNTLAIERGPSGYYIHTARLTPKLSADLMNRAFVRDAVNRNLSSPVSLSASGLLAWDSFNRADGAVGNAESGQAWTVVSGTYAIATNRLSCTSSGIITLDLGASNYDVEFRIVTTAANTLFLFGYQDASNRFRFGIASSGSRLERVVGGGVSYGLTLGILPVNGDLIRVSKRGANYNFYINDRFAFSYQDTLYVGSTVVGFQLNAGAVIDNFVAYAG